MGIQGLRDTKPERYNNDGFVLCAHLEFPDQLQGQDEYGEFSRGIEACDNSPSDLLTRTSRGIRSDIPS